jgi:beta-galactosidase/beta-glucuronidase
MRKVMNLHERVTISLAGEWRFQLDPKKEGINEKYYESILADRIILPGTTEENKKGYYNHAVEIDRLTRQFPYKGYAWYQCDIKVQKDWENKK